MEQFRAAIERQPHMADAHLNLALVYEKAGRIPDSLAHLSRYLRYDPQGNWARLCAQAPGGRPQRRRERKNRRENHEGNALSPHRALDVALQSPIFYTFYAGT